MRAASLRSCPADTHRHKHTLNPTEHLPVKDLHLTQTSAITSGSSITWTKNRLQQWSYKKNQPIVQVRTVRALNCGIIWMALVNTLGHRNQWSSAGLELKLALLRGHFSRKVIVWHFTLISPVSLGPPSLLTRHCVRDCRPLCARISERRAMPLHVDLALVQEVSMLSPEVT